MLQSPPFKLDSSFICLKINLRNKMQCLWTEMEKIANKIGLALLQNDALQDTKPGSSQLTRITGSSAICLHKHGQRETHDAGGQGGSLKHDILRMLIRSSICSHSFCLHVCRGASRFCVCSKKGCTYFPVKDETIVVTVGDQIQVTVCSVHLQLWYHFVTAFNYNKRDVYEIMHDPFSLCCLKAKVKRTFVQHFHYLMGSLCPHCLLQAWSGGLYKHVVGKPIFQNEEEEEASISIGFLYSHPLITDASSSSSCSTSVRGERIISLTEQIMVAACLTFLYHIVVYIYSST